MDRNIDLGDVTASGAYLVGASDLDTLDAAAHAEGHLVRRISLSGCTQRSDLIKRIATALEFPAYFGGNWDALDECLRNLEWLPQTAGYTWLFDHATDLRDAAEPDFDTLCDVLDGACANWREAGTPCFAFLALPDEAFSDHAPAA